MLYACVSGSIATITGTYGTALRLSGILLLIGGILFYLIPLAQKCQDRKKSANLKETSARELKEIL